MKVLHGISWPAVFLASGDNMSKLSVCLLPAAPTVTGRSVYQNERLANGPPRWITAPKSNCGKEYTGKDARLSTDFVAVEELKMYRQIQHSSFFVDIVPCSACLYFVIRGITWCSYLGKNVLVVYENWHCRLDFLVHCYKIVPIDAWIIRYYYEELMSGNVGRLRVAWLKLWGTRQSTDVSWLILTRIFYYTVVRFWTTFGFHFLNNFRR